MKSLFVELVEDVLIPVVILSGILVVAFVFYVALGYLLVVKMLLRELFLSLESHRETQDGNVVVPEYEWRPSSWGKGWRDLYEVKSGRSVLELKIEKREQEMKLVAPEEIKSLKKPLGIYELRQLGRAAGIKGASRMNKSDLLLALEIKS